MIERVLRVLYRCKMRIFFFKSPKVHCPEDVTFFPSVLGCWMDYSKIRPLLVCLLRGDREGYLREY